MDQPPADQARLDRQIAEGARVLAAGGLVAFPTETVYGLGADARSESAVRKIFDAKGRPSFNPLIVHVADIAVAKELARFSDIAEVLAAAFWPGPLTLVLPLRSGCGIAPSVTAGLETLGIRIPTHPVAQQLLKQFGGPVAAPSANPSGRLSPTDAPHVEAGLGGTVDVIIEGGAAEVGLESTIVEFDPEPVLLRDGGVPREALKAVLGRDIPFDTGNPDQPRSPGQLLAHYAPGQPLRLNARAPKPGETFLGFGRVDGDLNLSPQGSLDEAAAKLFAHLHTLDLRGAPIAVAPIPNVGIGRAINDRLRRAAGEG